MARPMTLSTSDVSTSNLGVLCHYPVPFDVTVDTIVTGTATYTLQYTTDDVQAAAYTPAGGNWKSHPQMTDATISDTVEFTSPVTAVRLNQTVGTGSVIGRVIQAGI